MLSIPGFNKLPIIPEEFKSSWARYLTYRASRRVDIMTVAGIIVYPFSLVDIDHVPLGEKYIFVLVRLLPSVVLTLALVLFRLKIIKHTPLYYLLTLTIFTASSYRVNDTDIVNYILLNANVFVLSGILSLINFKHILITSVVGFIINVIAYFTLYAESIPLHQAGLFLMFCLVLMNLIMNRFRLNAEIKSFLSTEVLKKKNDEIQESRDELLKLTVEVLTQKEEITKQRDRLQHKGEALTLALEDIAKKNRDITESIQYAKKIQEAFTPNDEDLSKAFQDFFILFKPRDIVSGDFYWFKQVNHIKVFSVVDCTGHGVPGAFMSVIGETILNYLVSIRKMTEPAAILQEMHDEIVRTLRQHVTKSLDGMEMSLCCIDDRSKEIRFAGAGLPIIFERDGELEFIKGDRMPLGGAMRFGNRVFNEKLLKYNKRAKIYLYTDGFTDQLGGVEGQKYKTVQLKAAIAKIRQLPMNQQKTSLEKELVNWMKKSKTAYPQVDDITLVGLSL